MKQVLGLLGLIVVVTAISGAVMSLLFTGALRTVAFVAVLGVGVLSTIIVLLDLVF